MIGLQADRKPDLPMCWLQDIFHSGRYATIAQDVLLLKNLLWPCCEDGQQMADSILGAMFLVRSMVSEIITILRNK